MQAMPCEDRGLRNMLYKFQQSSVIRNGTTKILLLILKHPSYICITFKFFKHFSKIFLNYLEVSLQFIQNVSKIFEDYEENMFKIFIKFLTSI